MAVWMRLCVLAFAALLSACATTGAAGPKTAAQRVDPWENWNRKVYGFNEVLDDAVLKPVATTYTKVVPQPVRTGVSNFFGNFDDAWSAINNFLQGKLTNGLQDVMRVGTNTIFGLGGLFDVASKFGLDRQSEDFGQTLGRWGVRSGPYVVWPLFGPSTLRDSFALPLDRAMSPNLVLEADGARAFSTGLNVVSQRASLLAATRMLDDIALDKYVFTRDAYLQRRNSLVHDGDVPPSDDDESDDGEGVDNAPPPASAPSAPAPAASAASGV
jgi:phospholipid-binding lipoprotein MlaA